jgi:hypothetical protein
MLRPERQNNETAHLVPDGRPVQDEQKKRSGEEQGRRPHPGGDSQHQASRRNPAMAAAKDPLAKIANECREESLNTVCQRNDAVKPGERRKQKENPANRAAS